MKEKLAKKFFYERLFRKVFKIFRDKALRKRKIKNKNILSQGSYVQKVLRNTIFA